MSYSPVVYIDVGATGAFFTLRETYEHVRHIPGEGAFGNAIINGVYQGSVEKEIRSFHHFNLSQNPDEAFAKAQAYADANAIKLDSTLEGLGSQLRDIQRANAEEISRREAHYQALRDAWEAERKLEESRLFDVIKAGCVPIGRFTGQFFEQVSRSYLTWLIDSRDTFEVGTLLRALADEVSQDCQDLRLPEPDRSFQYENEGERIEVQATVVRVASFDTDYGRKYITTLVSNDANRACIVVKSTSFCRDVGTSVSFKATVKGWENYKGQNQTVVQRVKVLDKQSEV